MYSTTILLALLPAFLSSVTAIPHSRDIDAMHLARGSHDRLAGDAEVIKRMIRRKKRSSSCPAKSPSSATTTTAATTTTLAVDNNIAHPAATTTSATTTTAAAQNTSPASTGMQSWLFPMSTKSDWTTWTGASDALSFTNALKPLTAGKLPSQSNAPDGTAALVANFPAGTFQYSSSTGAGYSFYTQGSHNNVDVTGAKDVIFSYSAYFPSGFDFVKGGKMPGLYGGTSLDQAKSCSGGRQDNRDECFSARLMWRTNGMGEFYNYYPTSIQQGNGYCNTAPMSICDTVYGDSIGRGSYSWSTGSWTTVAQRVRLNDVGQSNGEQQLWVNGQPIMHLTGLQIIVKPAKIYGIMAQTFFGGSDSTWASPKDQSVWFKDWSLAVIE